MRYIFSINVWWFFNLWGKEAVFVFTKGIIHLWRQQKMTNFIIFTPFIRRISFIIVSEFHFSFALHLCCIQNYCKYFCVCVKRITLCNCLCSSSPSSCEFASVIRNIGNSEQKTILQAIEQLIQNTVLEIHFWSLRYTVVIRISKNLSNLPFLYKRYKAKTVCWCKQPAWNSFGTLQTAYTYSNCMINQFL